MENDAKDDKSSIEGETPPATDIHITSFIPYFGNAKILNDMADLMNRVNSIKVNFPALQLMESCSSISLAIQSSMKVVGEEVGKAMSLASSQLSEKVNEVAKKMDETFQQRLALYPALKNEIQPLAKKGWFVSRYFGFSELDTLAQVASSRPSDLGGIIAKLYREDMSEHLHSISEEYPSRAFVLKPAVEAHLRGEFAISIPIFFIIADGIARERTGRYIFHKSSDKEKLLEVAQAELKELSEKDSQGIYLDFFNLFHSALWESVSEKLPIAYTEHFRKKHGYEGLNRHIFIHGDFAEEDATEENSLKAFSLLSCVSSLLADYSETAEHSQQNAK